MSLKNICNLIDNYDIVLVAYENEKEKSIKQILKEIKNNYSKEIKIAVLIGPEGGISLEEIEALTESGAMTMSLGKRILRTETVTLNVASIIMYELDE